MAAQVIGPAQTALNIYQALYGMAPSNALYTNYLSIIGSGSGALTFANQMAASFANTSSASLATTVLTNLGVNTAALNTALTQLFDGYGVAARGQIILNTVNALSNLEGDATWGAAAVAWNARTLANFNYAVDETHTTSAVPSSSTSGQSFTLTTNVDAVSGGAGDDVISGLLGTSATYSVGDNIFGGAGNDTLNLIASQHTANGLVSIDGVETINVRLVGTAAETVELNGADWSGVAVLSNASSLAATTLEVSGIESSTNVTLYGNTDVSVQYASTVTANAAGTLVDAGTFAGATNIWVSATANATAHLDFDLENAGLVSGIAVTLSGNNFARLEGGANAEVYTIVGAGSAVLVTDDTITSFDASAASANIDVTFEGASDVVAVGGAGNDTFRFGTTISNSDSVNGGAGTNTVYVTQGAFNRELHATNIQSATISFTDSGNLNVSGSTISTFNFSAAAASDASVSQIANAATINLTQNNLAAVTLDYVTGASTTTINLGSAASSSADVALTTLTVTDVATVTLNGVSGMSAGATASIATLSFDTDVKNLVIQTLGGTGSLELGSVAGSIGGATAVTFNANVANNINYLAAIDGGSTLTTLNVNTYGTAAASATLTDVGGTAVNTINLYASAEGDITLGALTLGNGASAAGATATINLTMGAEQDTTIGDIATTGGMALTINAGNIASSGSLVLNDLAMSQGSSTALPISITFNAMNIATAASFEIDGFDFEGSGTAAQVNIGTIVMSSGASLDFGSASGVSADGVNNVDVSAINLTMGKSATAHFGAIHTTAGAVGAITINLGEGATATFGTVSASAVGAHSLTLASGASASFGNIVAFSGGNANEGAVGSIEIGGVDASDVSFGTIGASSVGAIAVSGAVDVTFGKITTTTIGEINATAQGVSGSFTIDLSGVTNAVELKLGVATNVITSGNGNDVITLTGGRTAYAGNDTIAYVASGDGVDNVINFIAGNAASGGDVIRLDGDTLNLLDGSGDQVGNGVSGGATAVSILAVTTNATSLAADNNIVSIQATAFASTAALMSAISVGGSLALTNLADASAGGNLTVVWYDGSNTHVSLVGITGATNLITANADFDDLVTLQGITPAALVAANFDIL